MMLSTSSINTRLSLILMSRSPPLWGDSSSLTRLSKMLIALLIRILQWIGCFIRDRLLMLSNLSPLWAEIRTVCKQAATQASKMSKNPQYPKNQSMTTLKKCEKAARKKKFKNWKNSWKMMFPIQNTCCSRKKWNKATKIWPN